jgi:hypothetical protein
MFIVCMVVVGESRVRITIVVEEKVKTKFASITLFAATIRKSPKSI